MNERQTEWWFRIKSGNGSCCMTHYSLRPLLLPPLPVLHQLHWWRRKSLVCDKSSTTAIHLLGTTLNVITDCEPFLHPLLSPSESHFCCTAPNLAEAFSHIRLSHCTIQDKGGGGGGGGTGEQGGFSIPALQLQRFASRGKQLPCSNLPIWQSDFTSESQ